MISKLLSREENNLILILYFLFSLCKLAFKGAFIAEEVTLFLETLV